MQELGCQASLVGELFWVDTRGRGSNSLRQVRRRFNYQLCCYALKKRLYLYARTLQYSRILTIICLLTCNGVRNVITQQPYT